MKKVFTSLLFLSFSVFSFSQTAVVVDPNARRQTMKGFGVSLAWWANILGGWGDTVVNDVCTLLTDSNELNMNYFRFNIAGGDSSGHNHMRFDANMPGYKSTRTGSYDWSADANQRKFLKKLYSLKSGAIYEAASYSPPYWMTKSGCSAGNTDGTDNLNDSDYVAFADYLTEVVKHYKDVEGVPFSRLEPMNEPFSNWWKAKNWQEGCAFSQANQIKLINAVYNKLNTKNMLSYCKIIAMDANSIDEALNGLNGYPDSVLSKLNEISTHTYFGTKRVELYSAAAAKGKEVWQTESGPIISETGIDNYLVMANRIIADLKDMRAVVWADWQAMDFYGDYWGLWRYDTTNKTYNKVKSYYVRKQFSKYVKPGYTVIYSNESTIAALNPANNELVVVLVNADTSGNKSYKVDLNLFGSTGASASAYRTSSTQDCAQLSNISIANNIFSYTAPARSVTTFIIPVTLATNPIPIANGNYRITAKHSNKDMSVAATSDSNGAVIEQWTPLGQSNQVFNVQWTTAGYKLLPSYNAKAVTVNGNSLANGAVINQWTDLEQTNQRFSMIDVGGGYYKIVARHSAKCLAVTGNGMNNGDDVVQWEWLNYDNFKWQFTPVALDSTLANGTYTIKAKHSSKVMSVEGWSSDNGGIIEQWANLCQGNQKFSVQFTSSGYIIKPSYNNKNVSVNSYSIANGASIVQWDDFTQSHQRYQIINLGSGFYKIVARHSNKCLAVTGNGMNNGDDVVQWEWLNNDNFKWAFESPCASRTGATTTITNTTTNNNIGLLAENNPEYLKVYPNPSTGYIIIQSSGIDKAQVQIYDMSGKLMMIRNGLSNTETINVNKLAKGVYTLKISGSNKVVLEKIIVQ
ncbi:RICIN domain-containing protein [Terrimonas pollutisoli]|uniref:RICIN domain-containing protein n=1 Tax=Terrimonas pollutisoli TaxID=3034147 RepID=UPI0023ED4B51|nr:RICIN domain-containing protein [Terrimonas sp. H1YJ31]